MKTVEQIMGLADAYATEFLHGVTTNSKKKKNVKRSAQPSRNCTGMLPSGVITKPVKML